jgi:hypothetical protein
MPKPPGRPDTGCSSGASESCCRGATTAPPPGGGTVELLPECRDIWLWHEGGLLVGWVDGPECLATWEAAAWSQGRPGWPLPGRYDGTTAVKYFAETYTWFIEGHLGECCAWRLRLLQELLPELERSRDGAAVTKARAQSRKSYPDRRAPVERSLRRVEQELERRRAGLGEGLGIAELESLWD